MNITPMIDMTFLLLIFFMVTSKITKEQRKMEIRLPVAGAARIPENATGREIINLDERGRIFVGERGVSMRELKAYLKQRLADYPPLKVNVRADGQTSAHDIKEVMRGCAEAGAVQIIFSAHQK